MARKSTIVYSIDMLVHFELTEGVPFKTVQEVIKQLKDYCTVAEINMDKCVNAVTIEKVIVQKKVTY